MSIKPTQTISRSQAISRIRKVFLLAVNQKYKDIGACAFEPNYSTEDLINFCIWCDFGASFYVGSLEQLTNKQLEELMDRPFFRYSMFDNYFVVEDNNV